MPEISNSQIYNCYQQVYLNISYIDRYKRKKKRFDIDICEFQYIVVQMKFFAAEHKNLWADSRYISATE